MTFHGVIFFPCYYSEGYTGASLALISDIEPKDVIMQLLMQETYSRYYISCLLPLMSFRKVLCNLYFALWCHIAILISRYVLKILGFSCTLFHTLVIQKRIAVFLFLVNALCILFTTIYKVGPMQKDYFVSPLWIDHAILASLFSLRSVMGWFIIT
jgi:hypothetical protein